MNDKVLLISISKCSLLVSTTEQLSKVPLSKVPLNFMAVHVRVGSVL